MVVLQNTFSYSLLQNNFSIGYRNPNSELQISLFPYHAFFFAFLVFFLDFFVVLERAPKLHRNFRMLFDFVPKSEEMVQGHREPLAEKDVVC